MRAAVRGGRCLCLAWRAARPPRPPARGPTSVCARRHRATSSGAEYQGFGSFHVEHSVEDMARMTDAEFAAAVPDVHHELSFQAVGSRLLPTPGAPGAGFGAEARAALFALDERWTFLNHGAFGAPIEHGLRAAAAWRREAERQPLRFMDRTLLPEIARATRLVAASVLGGADPCDTVLVANATTGLNAVLGSLQRHGLLDGHVLLLDCGYGADKTMARHFTSAPSSSAASSTASHRVIEVPVLEGLTAANESTHVEEGGSSSASFDAYILRQVECALMEGPRVSLAVFDHVTSNTALKLPIAQLTRLCRAHGVPVMVDGAHSAGMVTSDLCFGAVDVGALPDFFVGNFHKWFLAPRGSGFLWCNPHTRAPGMGPEAAAAARGGGGGSGSDSGGRGPAWTDLIRHPVVSHGTEAGYHSSFSWCGNADYSPLLALRAVLDGAWGGGTRTAQAAAVEAYARDLCADAADLLAERWHPGSTAAGGGGGGGGGVFLADPRTSRNAAGAMALVQLPHARLELVGVHGALVGEVDARAAAGAPHGATSAHAKLVQDWLYAQRIEVPIKAVNGRLCARISAHVYNDLPQYTVLAEAVAGAVRT